MSEVAASESHRILSANRRRRGTGESVSVKSALEVVRCGPSGKGIHSSDPGLSSPCRELSQWGSSRLWRQLPAELRSLGHVMRRHWVGFLCSEVGIRSSVVTPFSHLSISSFAIYFDFYPLR
jgi:hypothetical protein